MRYTTLITLLLIGQLSYSQARKYIPMAIPVRDGATLAADLYTMDSTVAKPVILIQTPYNKAFYRIAVGLPQAGGQLPFDTINYNYVTLDWRGFYASTPAAKTGYDLGLDGYDAIEWIAKQTWSNGKVGTWGGSALGMIQFQTAKHRPPHHVCAVPFIIDYKASYDKYFPGGCFLEEHYNTTDSLGFGGTTLALAHPNLDAAWKYTEAATDYPDSIAVPLLMITGWYDHFPDGVIRAFKDLHERSFSDVRSKHKLIIGPWLHTEIGKSQQGILEYPESAGIPIDAALKFFDYYLRGVDNGYPNEPVTKYFDLGNHTWTTEQTTWQEATASGDTMSLYLAHPNTLGQGRPDSRSWLDYTYNPRDFSPSVGSSTFSSYLLHGPQDISQTIEKRNDVLSFTTDVLTAPITIRGKVQVLLYVQTDRTDTDFGVRLTDVYPDGRSIIITDAMKRLRFRDGFETQKLATPGTTYPITIELRNLAMTLPEGHQLRIDITSSNYPRFNLNPNSGTELYITGDTLTAKNTVNFGGGTSSVVKIPIPKKLSVMAESTGIGISCYPNPAKQMLTVRVYQEANSEVELVDALGRIVATNLLNAGETTFDVSTLSDGIYFVRIGATAQKILVRK
jgi:predicted acyl esterase